jgi:hypothetical protein
MGVLFTVSYLKLLKDSKESDFIGLLYFCIILCLSLILYVPCSKYGWVVCIYQFFLCISTIICHYEANIIIIVILVIAFMQGIYNYIPETNHVARVCCVAAVLCIRFLLHVMLFCLWNMFFTFAVALSAVRGVTIK